MRTRPKLVAVIGGSGAGKTWLSERLQQTFGSAAVRLSLDDFYLDRSSLPPSRRARINFDHPRAIDWPVAESVLRAFRAGRSAKVPRYSFATHVRLPHFEAVTPAPLIIWDGLWLLSRSALRPMFDLKIFLDCPTQLRLERRLARDVAERERPVESSREQFWKTVAPMHDRFVAPQAKWADIVLTQPCGKAELDEVIRVIHGLLPETAPGKTPPASSKGAAATAGGPVDTARPKSSWPGSASGAKSLLTHPGATGDSLSCCVSMESYPLGKPFHGLPGSVGFQSSSPLT